MHPTQEVTVKKMFKFIAGLFIGVILGVVTMALCVAGGRDELD